MKYISIAALILFTFVCSAQWTSNISVNTPVTSLQKSQQKMHLAPDGGNGAVICWEDSRTSSVTATDIYAQRMNSKGYAKWTINGLAICTNSAVQRSPSITDAGNGNVIIAWEDARTGSYDIYAQKIDSSGNILWAPDGVIVCNKPNRQKNPRLVSDSAGGAIVVWEDSLNFYWDIYAQRISSAGAPLWAAGGVSVCVAPNTQNNVRIDLTGAGGAIFTWQDKRNNADYDIYAQLINSSGAAQWTTDGIVICNAINTQSNPKIEPDGANGALVIWEDKRSSLDYDIYAQRISSTGVVQWAANGIAVVNTASNQSAPDMKYLGGNKFCVSWKDIRNGSYAVYAQLLDLSGTILLASNGVQISSALKSTNPNNIADGSGGVIVAWQDSTTTGWNLTSQKLNSSGIQQWAPGGITVTNAADDQVNVSQVSDGFGGAIYAWEDHRNTTDYDIFAQNLLSDGSTIAGVSEQAGSNVISAVCFPNPVTSHSVIKLKNNLSNKNWAITIYDTFGNIMESNNLKSNETFVINTFKYKTGIYFYCVMLNDHSASTTGKLIFNEND